MKTTAVRLYGKEDLRLETFELPAIKEDEIFMISPSIFCSFVVILIISPTLAMSKMKSKYMLFIF